MSKNIKNFLSVLLVICTVISVAIPTFAANIRKANSYASDWRYWSQADTKYYDGKKGGMDYGGCRLVAQSKLLTEAGITSKPFNPDVYLEWCAKKGYVYSVNAVGEKQTTGNAMIAYANNSGYNIERVAVVSISSKSPQEKINTVWSYIKKGYHVILGCDAHQAYISRVDSLAKEKPMISESSHSLSGGKIYAYSGIYKNNGCEAAFTNVYVYSVSKGNSSSVTSNSNTKSKLSITVKNATNITQNSAKVSASCSYSGTRPSEVSVYIGTSKKNMKKYSSDKINHSKNPFDIWYNIKNLKPGTTYYYQFNAIVNGTDKTGEIKSFTTPPAKASSTLTMNVKGASKITKTSARVDATCTYTGTRPSEVSVYIGTSKKNMKKYSSDKINHTKNPFNIWYNLSGLKKNTTYYYQFHAKVNGVDKAYGDIKSFKTAK